MTNRQLADGTWLMDVSWQQTEPTDQEDLRMCPECWSEEVCDDCAKHAQEACNQGFDFDRRQMEVHDGRTDLGDQAFDDVPF